MTKLSSTSRKIAILIGIGSILLISSFVVPLVVNRVKVSKVSNAPVSAKDSIKKPPVEILSLDSIRNKLPTEAEVKLTFEKVYDYSSKSLGSLSTLIGIILGIKSLKETKKKKKG